MKNRTLQIQICWRNYVSFNLLVLISIFHYFIFSALFVQAQTPADKFAAVVAPSPNSVAQASAKSDSSENNSLSKTLPPVAEKLIHNGDLIDIDVLGSLEYDWRGKTDDEGFLPALPFSNISIFALCQTESELAAKITTAYSKFIRNPQVVVRVLDRSARQPAVLFGAVTSPQRFLIQRQVRLNELIVMSGGITDQASGEIRIFRPARASCEGDNQNQAESHLSVKLAELLSGKNEANPVIRSGDIITVAEASPIYVTGGVATPQRVLFRQGMTLSRVIASAGGAIRGADTNHIAVYRRQNNQNDLKIIEADLEKIMNQKADDILLKEFDVVEVPQTERVRRPPIVSTVGTTQFDIGKLPLRIIN